MPIRDTLPGTTSTRSQGRQDLCQGPLVGGASLAVYKTKAGRQGLSTLFYVKLVLDGRLEVTQMTKFANNFQNGGAGAQAPG